MRGRRRLLPQCRGAPVRPLGPSSRPRPGTRPRRARTRRGSARESDAPRCTPSRLLSAGSRRRVDARARLLRGPDPSELAFHGPRLWGVAAGSRGKPTSRQASSPALGLESWQDPRDGGQPPAPAYAVLSGHGNTSSPRLARPTALPLPPSVTTSRNTRCGRPFPPVTACLTRSRSWSP